MASNIVLTPQDGEGNTITLYGDRDAAENASAFLYWTKWNVKRENPWKQSQPTAYAGIEALHMGEKPLMYTIQGVIFGATEANMTTGRTLVMEANKFEDRYTVTGPFTNKDATGMICTEAFTGDIGEGTGPQQPFTIVIVDLVA